MAESDASKMSSENQALLRVLSLELQNNNQAMMRHFTAEMRELDKSTELRIGAMEGRVSTQLSEIKDEQRALRDTIQVVRDKQEEQGGDIREIKARLNEGDRRMDQHEEEIADIADKVEEQPSKSRDAAIAVAGLGGGGAISYAIQRIFGG